MSAEQMLWQRLNENQSANAAAFRAAHINLDHLPVLTCAACGLMENTLFWTPSCRSSSTVDLACPLCNAAGTRYNLRRQRVRDPRHVRRLILFCVTVIVMLLASAGAFLQFAPPPEQVRYTMQRNWQQARALPGDARAWVEQALSRHGRSRRR
jgi:hypothetical protein